METTKPNYHQGKIARILLLVIAVTIFLVGAIFLAGKYTGTAPFSPTPVPESASAQTVARVTAQSALPPVTISLSSKVQSATAQSFDIVLQTKETALNGFQIFLTAAYTSSAPPQITVTSTDSQLNYLLKEASIDEK